ncbi:Hypothetical_protein [Hexamita inflata]|uniref:Hypothetical_protein n=1 Tax=Hexamita inflata TaxID=28002 RepID=A0AA86PV85_9EUKA|nr:Hypothetical protein HINF_LOCUS5752 [Hexamita inflata]CAI9937268.1 Hypothetical protein HINF_LOCUS24913 [Hexamita inflata]CAI9938607.1 Hypothetical protein HINF_LOCUS26252 [Hexamita inflata]CAI9946874.1 Hypothetical protein HINF_LOCUS34519 [Hexamita inflata]CAI9967238.1 Hypothetical protein HINF_LOCUS54883 [Hexamita inflata]
MNQNRMPNQAQIENNLKIIMGKDALVLMYDKIKQLSPTQLIASFRQELKDPRLDPVFSSLYHPRMRIFLKRNVPLQEQDIVQSDALIVVPLHKFAGMLCYLSEINQL